MPEELLDIIKQNIRQNGAMDMGEYMSLCLSHPQHGYYMTRDPFGARGDFITAPEISQLFGEMIGVWCADLWIKMGRPQQFALVECGPGRGTLMSDIMRVTNGVSGFHTSVKIHLMEISPALKAKQAQILAQFKPVWIENLEDVSADMPIILIGNEFLDALPIRQLMRQNGEWQERTVDYEEGRGLFLSGRPINNDTQRFIPKEVLAGKEDGIFEISPILNQFLKSLIFLLQKQTGGALFIDYGYMKTAMGDSLQAMKNHQYTNIFDTLGLCDLTAHVDFERLLEEGRAGGTCVHGVVTQAQFLKNLGITHRANALCNTATSNQVKEIMSGLARLIDTAQMGNLFKVAAYCNDPQITPSGFHESF